MTTENSEDQCLDAAVALKDQGRYEDAIGLLEARGKVSPLLPKSRSFLALLYGCVGRIPEALAILEADVLEHPRSYRASFGLLLIFSGLDDARRLRQEASRWLAAWGEEPLPDETRHRLSDLYARLVAANEDDEVLRLADEALDEQFE